MPSRPHKKRFSKAPSTVGTCWEKRGQRSIGMRLSLAQTCTIGLPSLLLRLVAVYLLVRRTLPGDETDYGDQIFFQNIGSLV